MAVRGNDAFESMGGDVTKRPVAVVLGITADMAFAAANVLLGLERFPPADGYDVVIFHHMAESGRTPRPDWWNAA